MVTFNYPRSSFIGFDDIFFEMERIAGLSSSNDYPKHNVIKHNDSEYAIELALAGFKRSEIDLELVQNILTIKGTKDEREDTQYIHKGISTKDFIKTFRLASDVVIDSASFTDGLLTIQLKVVIPEERKPKKIFIKDEKKLLLETQE